MDTQGLHLHLDPVGGAAGDMFIAAMLHAMPDLLERVMADVAAVLPAGVGHAKLTEYMASGIAARQFNLVLAEGGDVARQALLDLQNDRDKEVRNAVQEGLQTITSKK